MLIGLMLSICVVASGCKSRDEKAPKEQPTEYGQPIGARVTGNGKVPSFEVALATKGAAPDNSLSQAIQAVTSMSSNCSAFADAMARQGGVTMTFQTKQRLLVPDMVQAEGFDEQELSCLRKELQNAMTSPANELEVKFLLQVRPLAG